jgi:predicted dienelactone hydrolase
MAPRIAPVLLVFVTLLGCASRPRSVEGRQETRVLVDSVRQRTIPIAVYSPSPRHHCSITLRCPVALLSAGHGMQNSQYAFLGVAVADLGFLVIGIQHDQPGDAPLATSGDWYTLRMPVWRIGVANLQFVRSTLRAGYPQFDWDHLVLLGHSNGGDVSALLAHDEPDLVATLVTLDNRRYPLPRTTRPRVMSIRAGDDVAADPGVLPDAREQEEHGIRIVTIKAARHGDMSEFGSTATKQEIVAAVTAFLRAGAAAPVGTTSRP